MQVFDAPRAGPGPACGKGRLETVKQKMVKIFSAVLAAAVVAVGGFAAAGGGDAGESAGLLQEIFSLFAGEEGAAGGTVSAFSLEDYPAYEGQAYAEVNGNVPYFSDADLTTEAFENYSQLDELGRCGVAYANICTQLMPTEKRGSIGGVRPSGWHTVRYDELIPDGKYLYNRCHLIGYQLAGENANRQNLITGTRYLNVTGMLPFENDTAEYVEETGNHVLYRVTPVFEGDDLVAKGVLMEAKSVEDRGEGLQFCVFCYNVQPGVVIDYATGESRAA